MLRAVTLAALVCGCSTSPNVSATARPFELQCDSSDTDESSTLFCVRHDTRTGDVKRVDLDRLPRSSGPTATTTGPPGQYQLVCDATSTAVRADFFCVRLHTDTGELLLINLLQTSQIPSEP